MPNNVDFTGLFSLNSFKVKVPYWKPLVIEYGYGYIQRALHMYWRVQGTTHTFRMSYIELMNTTNGDYEKHIQEFLESFRKEYLDWAFKGFKEPWMVEYHEQYKNFIELQ